MTSKTLILTYTLTSLKLLNQIKISFSEYEPLQKNSQTLTLVSHFDSKKNLKTTYVMINLRLCVPNKGTYMINQLY